jgi:hypothetical protein
MMWFMNHVFNPIVRWILSSPVLHGLASKDLVLIAFTGQKSKKHYSTPVEYQQDGQILWIIVGFPEKKKWWKNLIGGTSINLCLRGEWVSGEAFAYQGEQSPEEVTQGLMLWAKKFPKIAERYASEEEIKKNVLVKVILD